MTSIRSLWPLRCRAPVAAVVVSACSSFLPHADLSSSIEGRNVILVEDVVDSGRTADYLRRNLETRDPRSLQVCTLLDKVERRQVDVPLDYVGFVIPDRFVVAYGFDVDGLYRNLPEIYALEDG